MTTQNYILKVSSQGQVTLPAKLRKQLGVKLGSRVVLRQAQDNTLVIDRTLPIEHYFGSLGNLITAGEDAAEYVRKLRDEDNRHRQKKLRP